MTTPFHEDSLCRHGIAETRCQHCQMVAFLSVNEHSAELPYMVEDASRLIFKQLQLLYQQEMLVQLRLLEQWKLFASGPFKEITGDGDFFARMEYIELPYPRPIFMTKKRYTPGPVAYRNMPSQDVENELLKQLQTDEKKTRADEKAIRRAQQQERRRHKWVDNWHQLLKVYCGRFPLLKFYPFVALTKSYNRVSRSIVNSSFIIPHLTQTT